jgi:hypothetical protein
MPYNHHKIKGEGECVFKKENNEKVGCTNGPINDYLAALHMHPDEPKTENKITESENNTIIGGKADKMSVEDIADKFNVPISKIKTQIKKGVKVEFEHTKSTEKATEIAMDHLSEFPDYYDRLDKMEKEADKVWNKKDVNENTKTLIKRLIRENLLKKKTYLNN